MVSHSSYFPIQVLVQEHEQLVSYLESTGDISLQFSVKASFSKTLLLSAASFFENRMVASIIDIFEERTGNSDALVSFVRSKAATRRYHDWFSWKDQNANRFFSAFGGSFKEFMSQKLNDDPDLEKSISAFLELGRLRNQLVHENYSVFSLNKTVQDVFDLYNSAARFVDRFPDDIREYMNTPESQT